jgi:hypothetical protein
MEPNAGGEPRPRAEATQERKLLGVGSSAWFGGDGLGLGLGPGPGMRLPHGLAGAAHADEEVRILAVARR